MKSCSSTSSTSSSSGNSGTTATTDPPTEGEKEDGGICSLYCLARCLTVPADLGLVLLQQKDALNLTDLCECHLSNLLGNYSCSSDGALQFLQASIFENVPPTILFYSKGVKVKKPPSRFVSQLTWCNNSLLALVVRHSLAASHFKLVDESKQWIGYWGRHLKSIQFRTLKPFQKVNHFPGAFHLGRKDRLWMHLFEFMQRFEGDLFSVMPFTYILPRDSKKLRIYLSMRTVVHVILKPPASARGTGISIVSHYNMVPPKTMLVAQHYIESPFIINDAKFDLRIYVYVTSYDPLRVYIYEEGLVRFASVAYSPALSSYSNQFMHLTNYSINKQAHLSGNSEEPVQKWCISKFWDYLDEQGHDSAKLRHDIQLVAIKAIVSCESYIRAHAVQYSDYPFVSHELYGMDILVDVNLRPWLIEMNISPSLHSSTPLDVTVKAPLAKDVLNMSGIPFPPINTDDEFDTSLYLRTRNLQMYKTKEHLEKEQRHLEYFVANLEIDESILEDLTDADLRILVEFEDELTRKGAFELVYPMGKASLQFLRCMKSPIYSNLLLAKWQQWQSEDRSGGIQLIGEHCAKGCHISRKVCISAEIDVNEDKRNSRRDSSSEESSGGSGAGKRCEQIKPLL